MRWIKGCVSNVFFSIFINGRPRGKIKCHRGLRQEDPLSPFLINLVIDGLGRLVDRAKVVTEVRGLEVGWDKIEISHIQFADDTLFFVKSKSHLRCLVGILDDFGRKAGLTINLDESVLLGLNRSEEELAEMALELGCKQGEWPINYLGLPLGGNPRRIEFWEPVISKMSKN